MNDLISRTFDNRTEKQVERNFERSKVNEKVVMSALFAEYYAKGYPPETIVSQEIDSSEGFLDMNPTGLPDYFFSIPDRVFTFEIKCLYKGYPRDGVFKAKCSSIITMIKNPLTFKNGHLLVATDRTYATILASEVGKYKIEVIEEYSTKDVKKKGFAVPIKDFDWQPWLTPIQFAP